MLERAANFDQAMMERVDAGGWFRRQWDKAFGRVSDGYDGADFERAVALVSAEPSPRALVERLGLDWEYLTLARARCVRGGARRARRAARRRRLDGGEAFTAGFLIGVHLRSSRRSKPPQLAAAVDPVQERGRHAVIADHCDLASVARLETVYSEALVESMALAERRATRSLRSPVTRIFEAGSRWGWSSAQAAATATAGRAEQT